MIYHNRQLIFGHKVIKIQIILGLLCTLIIAWLTKNYNDILSSLTGMVLVALPTIVYSIIAFRYGAVALPVAALKRHQKAMLVRFGLNFILFIVVMIIYKHCNFMLLFITYLVTFSGYWFSLIVSDHISQK